MYIGIDWEIIVKPVLHYLFSKDVSTVIYDPIIYIYHVCDNI